MKTLLLIVAMVVVTPCIAGGGSAYGLSHHIPGDLEANFLVHLFQYVSWPDAPVDTATICFLEPSDVQRRLQSGVSNNESWTQIPRRKVIIKMLSDEEVKALYKPDDTLGCQVLFLDARSADRIWDTLSSASMPKSIVTVSTGRNFAIRGGMFEILWDSSDAYRLLTNQTSVLNGNFVASGALRNLADRVDDARYHTH